ncbi:MAG: hypothetical protein WAW41_16895 [Methylobacter sp.]
MNTVGYMKTALLFTPGVIARFAPTVADPPSSLSNSSHWTKKPA